MDSSGDIWAELNKNDPLVFSRCFDSRRDKLIEFVSVLKKSKQDEALAHVIGGMEKEIADIDRVEHLVFKALGKMALGELIKVAGHE